jgi:hypothetical protein
MRIKVYTAQIESYESAHWPSFATKAEAFKAARDYVKTHPAEGEIEVTEDTTADLPPRQLAVLLLSGEGWCAESQTIRVFKGKGHAQ